MDLKTPSAAASSVLPPAEPNSALAALLGGRHSRPMYQPPPQPKEIPTHFFIGNTADAAMQKGNNWYEWKFFVSRDQFKLTSVLDFIERVQLTLPPNYSKQGATDITLTPDDGMCCGCCCVCSALCCCRKCVLTRSSDSSPSPGSDGALTVQRFGYGEATLTVAITFKDAKRAPINTTYQLSYAKSIQATLTAVPAQTDSSSGAAAATGAAGVAGATASVDAAAKK